MPPPAVSSLRVCLSGREPSPRQPRAVPDGGEHLLSVSGADPEPHTRPAHCAESDQCHLRYPINAEFFCKPVTAFVADTTDATFPWSSRPQTHDPSGERRGHESLRWVGEDVLEQPEWAGVTVANQPRTRQAVSWEVPSRTEPQLPQQTPSRMPFPGAMSVPRPPLQAPLGIASQINFCHCHPHFWACI